MTAFVTAVLFIASCVHLFLFAFNRLLSMDPGPLKLQLRYTWPLVSVALPAGLTILFFRWEPLHSALSWNPSGTLSHAFSYVILALICFFAARSLLWLFARFFPEKPAALLEENATRPALPAVPSPLPRGFRWCDTSGELELIEREIAVSGLAPAFDGITIAQVSDVHFGHRREMENYLLAIREMVCGLSADFVVFTGDLVNERRHIVRSVEYHAGFRGRLATLAVLGNHDYWTNPGRIKDELERTPIRWLGGGALRSIKKNGRRLTFTGTDAPWTRERPDLRRIVRRGTGDAVVFLAHTPDIAPLAAKAGASLVLSGHTHGGELNLPAIGPIVVPSRYGLKYASGVFKVGVDTVLNVSRGVGVSSDGGLRLFCRPEITLITLRAPAIDVMVGKIVPARILFSQVESESGEVALG